MSTPVKSFIISALFVCITNLFASSALAKAPLKVAILLFDEVQIIDFAAPYEVFGQAGFDVVTVSKNGKPITSVMGMQVTPTHSFNNAPSVDVVLVPGGNVHHAMEDKGIHRWLQAQQKATDHILSVCTGAYILAESGLLSGLKATTFHRSIPSFTRQYPSISVQANQRFVDNGQIITSAGLSSGIDASLHLVRKILGEERAKTLALHIEYDWDPSGGFVRANMADQHLPKTNFDWPQGVKFDRLSAYGDETHWQETFKATTSVGVEQLVATYQKGMKQYDDWLPESRQTSKAFRWIGRGEHQYWQHELSVKPTEADDEFIVSVNVKLVN